MPETVCDRTFTIPEAPPDICGATPASIQNMVWTQAPTGEQPPCGVFTITNGSGPWQLTYNLTTCIEGFILITGDICNPGAPYLITVTIPWDDSGTIAPGPDDITWNLVIGGFTVDTETRSLATGPFTDVVLTGTIPGATIVTLEIQVAMNTSPAPEVEAHSTGNLTITPLTPP